MALNMGTSPEMIRKHYGHDDTVTRANEFVDDLEWQLGKRNDGLL
ncbi:hypothetical protein [Novispirillum itersonii]|nr:hypothetical protein [Novispirillum itersonii]